jgi:hypothetical protein
VSFEVAGLEIPTHSKEHKNISGRGIEISNEYKIVIGISKRRWVDDIKVDLEEIGVWSGLMWLRVGTGGGIL